MNTSNAASNFGIIINNKGQIHLEEDNDYAAYLAGTLIAVLGVCGNGFVLLICLISKNLRNLSKRASMKTVLNLAMTDLLTMICVGFNTSLFLFDAKNFQSSYYVCSVTVTFTVHMTFVTHFVFCITTLERYISICHQQRYHILLTNRSLNGLLISAWVIPLPFSLLPVFGLNHWNELQTCLPLYLYHKWNLIAASVFFILVMTFTVILYIPIISKAREFHLKTRPAQFMGVNERTARLKARKQAFRYSFFIGMLTLIFMICNLPFSIVMFIYGVGFSVETTTIKATFLLGILNCVVNPFLYACQKQLFCQEAAKVIRCKCCNLNRADESVLRDNRVRIPLLAIAPLPSRQQNTSGRCDQEVPVRSVHANNSSTNICQTSLTRTIHVKPYKEIIAETSL